MITDAQVEAALEAWAERGKDLHANMWDQMHFALEAADAAAWQPIETAPHAVDVILHSPDRGVSNPAAMELRPYSVGVVGARSYHAWATHWRHLPEPPK
jgi:hypothetical protein